MVDAYGSLAVVSFTFAISMSCGDNLHSVTRDNLSGTPFGRKMCGKGGIPAVASVSWRSLDDRVG